MMSESNFESWQKLSFSEVFRGSIAVGVL